jgi:hypothetical protein
MGEGDVRMDEEVGGRGRVEEVGEGKGEERKK